MSRLPVTPRKQLGQHFLADANVLGVIARLAQLDADDVVLEIGPGLGVLTEALAERVRHVHAVEIDASLAPHLRQRLAGRENVSLLLGDALRLDLASLAPPPGKLVANLPYNVATPLVVESVERLQSVQRWCVMVQREVAERFHASPGTKAYGAVSVLLRLTTRRTGLHAVSRTVFRPPPRVDSALVAFVRRGPLPDDYRRVKRLVEAAFAHRRKTLANSVALSGLVERAVAVAALQELGRPAAARAEQLEPADFAQLAALLP